MTYEIRGVLREWRYLGSQGVCKGRRCVELRGVKRMVCVKLRDMGIKGMCEQEMCQIKSPLILSLFNSNNKMMKTSLLHKPTMTYDCNIIWSFFIYLFLILFCLAIFNLKWTFILLYAIVSQILYILNILKLNILFVFSLGKLEDAIFYVSNF